MLNQIVRQLRCYDMVKPGDRVICAVSGGADSMAMLWSFYLLRDKLGITLEAAHFNHQLRGLESDRDEQFVRNFCKEFAIPLHVGSAPVQAGEKGLEAAAREARYGFLSTLGGKIATAHTADDNAETVLMHLVRGTGLKGLGGISPVRGNVIRPMLNVTRRQVLAFLEEYHISYVDDSSNEGDAFLRNRIRHKVMPLLAEENPKLSENLSDMAQRLRLDADYLEQQADNCKTMSVTQLQQMPSVIRSRVLSRFLKESGVKEPEAGHISLLEGLVFSDKPSASAAFPGGVTICRQYDTLVKSMGGEALETIMLPKNGQVLLPQLGIRVVCREAEELLNTDTVFTVCPVGEMVLRCRQSGDTIRMPGGNKSVKKLFIDRKIPAQQRLQIPILADSQGVLGIAGISVNRERMAKDLPAVQIRFESMNTSEKL